ILVAIGTSFVVACSGSSDATPSGSAADASTGDDAASGDDDTQKDASSDAPPPIVLADAGDYGAVSTTYPAFGIDEPQIVKGSASAIANPVAITITWTSDPDEATYEDFGDKIGASPYWSATTSEYGVGPMISGAANHVRISTPAPSTMTYADVEN